MKILVRMNEWFFTQALVGYKIILENYGEKVETTHDGIFVERRHLEVLPEAFFSYYLDEYSVAKREERRLRPLHKRFKDGDKSVKREINTNLNKIKNSSNRYFKETEAGKKLTEAADLYRKEKNYRKEMDDWLETFIRMLHTKEIDEKLTANVFRSVYLYEYFGQTSVLNVTHNNKSITELKEIFHKDFINPVIEELNLINALASDDEQNVQEILAQSTHKHFGFIKRGFRKKTNKEMKAFLQQEVHRCSLTDFPIALWSFEEATFV